MANPPAECILTASRPGICGGCNGPYAINDKIYAVYNSHNKVTTIVHDACLQVWLAKDKG